MSAIDGANTPRSGGPGGFIGHPVEQRSGKRRDAHRRRRAWGCSRDFQGGSIYWSPATGAFEVHGLIRVKWAQLGGEREFLGFPLTDELGTPDGIGRFNHFEGGSIYWTPETGAHRSPWRHPRQMAKPRLGDRLSTLSHLRIENSAKWPRAVERVPGRLHPLDSRGWCRSPAAHRLETRTKAMISAR